MEQALTKHLDETIPNWPDFLSEIKQELFEVEKNLNSSLQAKSKILSSIISYIFNSGGKRFRPALCLLTGKATGGITNKHIILAELTELIHTASLVHDDIIDSSSLRRGKETINSLWNDKISVITGDFLFAQASMRLGDLENTEIVKIYAKVLSDLCDGEIEQYSYKFNPNISWDYYIQKSTTKTASLFNAACKSAAMLNTKDKKVIEHAENFGNSLGIAFQITDDILDFTSTKIKSGKEIYSDLKQGLITAPTLFALKSTDKRAKQLEKLIENQFDGSDATLSQAIRIIFELGSCEKAEALAKEYIVQAKENLDFAKDIYLKETLEKAADFVLNRA